MKSLAKGLAGAWLEGGHNPLPTASSWGACCSRPKPPAQTQTADVNLQIIQLKLNIKGSTVMTAQQNGN